MNEPEPRSPANLNPPGVWLPARKSVQRLLAPVERFLAVEAASGIILMIVALIALVWANSPWRAFYLDLWHTPIGIRFGNVVFEHDLHFWINEGLMTIFFFVVGLEIRREIHAGELSEIRRAALPLAAAMGGMLVPALIFLALNFGRTSASGWAVPVATDIAFAVGALALLAKRMTPAGRILLLALAVIDDVGAIVVIALFYSSEIAAAGFAVLGLGILGIVGFQLLGVRKPAAYAAPAMVVWTGAYVAGIHPTLAGVIVGFMTPVRAWYGTETFVDRTEAGVQSLRSRDMTEDHALLPHLEKLRVANREAVSPLQRLEYQLHGWVAYGIMPLFAFANAGVPLGGVSFEGDALWVFLGVLIGLALGKPIGIFFLSMVATRFGLAVLPNGMQWSHISVVGMVAGIGFTMALFIAQLAFPAGPLLETAKLAVLCGSGVAAGVSLIAGYRILKPAVGVRDASDKEAEASTDK